MSPPGSLADLLGAVVRVGTIRVGHVAGVFVDGTGLRAIGLELVTAGGVRRFLPWVAVRWRDGAILVESAFVIVDDGASYERLGARPIRDPALLESVCALPNGAVERAPETVSGGPPAGIGRR